MNFLTAVAKLTLDTSEYESSMDKAENKASGFGEKFSAMTGKIVGLGVKAFSAATAAVSAFGAASVKTGMDFDKSMSQVYATMGDKANEMVEYNGKTVSSMEALRDFAQEMGATTAFSAKQSADALNYMALAGYDATTSMQMLPNVMSLAAAGGFDLARASDMVTDTQTAFGISIERTSQMVDEMAKAASTGNTSVEQLGDAFLVVGGLAKELNGGFVTLADGTKAEVDGIQEMEIALTAMANAGVKGSEAGTHMRNMIMKLSSPTKEGAKQMAALGVDVFDAEGNMRSLQSIMGDLSASLGDLTQEQKIKAIAELFNARDLSSAEALLGAVEQDWDKIGESILNAEGAAQTMADTQLDNLAGDITLFKSALEGAQIAVSDNLSPALRDFVKIGTDGLSEFAKTLNSGDISGAIKNIGNTVGNLASMVISKVPDMLSAGAVLLDGIVEGISTAVSGIDFGNVVVPLIIGLSEKIRDAAGELTTAGLEILRGIGEGISNNSSYLIGIASTIFGNLYSAISENLPTLLSAALQALTSLGEGIKNNLPSFLQNTVLPFALQVSESLRSFASNFADVGINFILNLAQGIMDSLPTLLEQLPQIIINIAGVINDNAPKLIAAGIQLIVMVGKGIINAVPALIENFPKIFEAILSVWSAFSWADLGSKAVTFIKNGVKSLASQIPNAIRDIGKNAVNFFKNLSWNSAGVDAIQYILNGIASLVSNIPNALRDIGHSAVSAFGEIDWFEVGSNVISGIVRGITGNLSWIADAARSAASRALEAAKNFLNIQSPSKVFRDQVGAMISKGWALGIEDGGGLIDKAISGISDKTAKGIEFDVNPLDMVLQTESAGVPNRDGRTINNIFNITVDGTKESPEEYASRLVAQLELDLRTI